VNTYKRLSGGSFSNEKWVSGRERRKGKIEYWVIIINKKSK
jgi:hypothetical protein